jgi:DNA helicase-2/ATP-dependent DNA helicase PcrA
MLNEEQQQVVVSNDRFLFLLAGAGSGKTRVLIERMKRLIAEGEDPRGMLAITFTRKASIEMQERLNDSRVSIHTFHQLAYIKLEECFNFEVNVIDEGELQNYTEDDLLSITNYKNSLYKGKKPKVFDRYQQDLIRHSSVDFDDLLITFLREIKHHPERLRYRFIFVDEFQDTNPLQYALLKQLTQKDTSVFAVGDPDQSIYQFRGATPQIIDDFIKDYQASVYKLTLNYRSHRAILMRANQLIKYNSRKYPKDLIPTKDEQGKAFAMRFNDDIHEAQTIISIIKILKQQGTPYENIAVFFRHHHRAYSLMLSFHDEHIQFQRQDDLETFHEGIHLMSIHQSKGLEFDVVFIIGCEEGILPSRRINMISAHEEERRLMFVAITRARHLLIATSIICNRENHHFTSSVFLRESGLKNISHTRISDIISLGDYDGHQKTHQRVGRFTQSSKP